MKKKLWLLLCLTVAIVAVFAITTVGVSAADKVDIFVENAEINQGDQPAFIYNDRTMVPLRAVSENLGMTVTWHPENRSVVIFDPMTANTYIYRIGNPDMIIDYADGGSDIYYFDTAPFITDKNRTVVPIRPVGEMYGKVEWYQDFGVYLYANEEHVPALKNNAFRNLFYSMPDAARCGMLDMNNDGHFEYFIRTGESEAEYVIHFYSDNGGCFTELGSVPAGHSFLEQDASGNVYLHYGLMFVDKADRIILDNNRISTRSYISEHEISDWEYENYGYPKYGTTIREYSSFMY